MENINDEFESKIEKVIVYQTGVQIMQVGYIKLPQGNQIVKISDLPNNIDKESIRVKGSGKGKIININVELKSKTEYQKEKYEEIKAEREYLAKEINKHQNRINRLNEQITKLKNVEQNFYVKFPKAYAKGDTDLSKFSEFNTKIDETIRSKINTIYILDEKLKELREKQQLLKTKVANIGKLEKIIKYFEITVNLNVFEISEFTLEIRYTMTQAYWVPFYDISLSEDKAKLSMMANVFNRTGLDWDNVEVEISTASLSPISLVEPTPMILEEYVPYYPPEEKKKEKKLAPKKAYKRDKDYDMDELVDDISGLGWGGEEPEPMPEEPMIEEVYAEVSENIGVQSFKIPDRIDIPYDKNPHPVNLTIQELDTEKKYFWSSAAAENVIIRDKIINGDLLLLAGNVKIYYLEEFLGESSIPLIAPKEEFKLGTRVSYDLKIDKKLVDRSKDKKAIKGKLKNNYEYKIIIKNLNDVSEELTIFDRIPHSYSENIKVDMVEVTPEPDKKELGILKWKFDLKGIDEKIIHYKYFVEYKKDITITPALP